MKALCRDMDQCRSFTLAEVDRPQPGPDQVLIRVAYAGICGSDLHIYDGSDADLPQAIHGHEFSGIVEEVGRDVQDIVPGQRVTAEHTYSFCGRCEFCLSGRYNLCKKRESIGFDIQGAFAEYVLADSRLVHLLPCEVPMTWGALTEPLACIYHLLNLTTLPAVASVLVVGPGPMGYLSAAVMRAGGHDVSVIGTSRDKIRLDIFKNNGFKVVDEIEADAYDVVMECSGSEGGVRSAIRAVKRGGRILQVGITTKDIALPYEQMVYKEMDIQGGFCHTYPDWEMAITAMALKTIDLDPVITDIVTIDDWEQSFCNLMNQESMKILFQFSCEEEDE